MHGWGFFQVLDGIECSWGALSFWMVLLRKIQVSGVRAQWEDFCQECQRRPAEGA